MQYFHFTSFSYHCQNWHARELHFELFYRQIFSEKRPLFPLRWFQKDKNSQGLNVSAHCTNVEATCFRETRKNLGEKSVDRIVRYNFDSQLPTEFDYIQSVQFTRNKIDRETTKQTRQTCINLLFLLEAFKAVISSVTVPPLNSRGRAAFQEKSS